MPSPLIKTTKTPPTLARPSSLAAVLARFAESGVTDAERVEFLTANLSACCQRCRTSLAPMDLLRLGLGAQAETVGDERLARVLRGYCAKSGCESYYYLFTFRPNVRVDWSGIEPTEKATPAKAQLDDVAQENLARLRRERQAARRCSFVRAFVGVLILLLLLLARFWQIGKPIPGLREPRKFTVAPQPEPPVVAVDPAAPAAKTLTLAPGAEAPPDPEMPDLTKIKPDPKKKK